MDFPPYRPPFFLRDGHSQSIWPKLIQPLLPDYRRELHRDSTDQTDVAYDFVDAPQADAPLLLLFHGLEGSSHSHYARAIMHTVVRHGWHGVVAHFRGCGDVVNTANICYHSGDSLEIKHIINDLSEKYPQIYAVGISLGGHALAKYLGENRDNTPLQAAAIVSAPLDLPAASQALEHGLSKTLYAPYFLRSLLPKVAQTAAYFPQIDLAAVQRAQSLKAFDDAFTAPVHGFDSAEHYYQTVSAKPFLRHIAIPTLLLNAKNDPFMPADALPSANDVADCVVLLQPEQGGHAGFPSARHLNWLPETVMRFFQAQQR